jgi:hypothetical protein
MAGIDLEVVQALPHSPDAAEVRLAGGSLWKLVGELKAGDPERLPGEARGVVGLGREGGGDPPF